MYKFTKGALVFTGGLTVGAGFITGVFLSSKDIRKLLARKLADALVNED